MRLNGIFTEAAFLVFFIVGKIAFEPFHMTVAFKGENVGGQPVEEHTVVADDHGAASKILERLFQSCERFVTTSQKLPGCNSATSTGALGN